MATKEFEELALNGSNYPTWASDIKIVLASRSLLATIQEPQTKVILQDKHTCRCFEQTPASKFIIVAR